MNIDFKPKPKPEVRIAWQSVSRSPFSWETGSETWSYGPSDLTGERSLKPSNAVYKIELGEEVRFQAITNFNPEETGRIPLYCEWDFGDGSHFRSAVNRGKKEYATAVHSYNILSLEGKDAVQVSLTVTDNRGGRWRARTQLYLAIPVFNKPIAFSESELLIPPIP